VLECRERTTCPLLVLLIMFPPHLAEHLDLIMEHGIAGWQKYRKRGTIPGIDKEIQEFFGSSPGHGGAIPHGWSGRYDFAHRHRE
jgi:hypothetical protein